MIQDIDSLLNVAGVYTIIHTASGRTYVGEALNVRGRWKSHFTCLARNKHNNYFLQQAWNKYGPAAFEFKSFLTLERLPGESNHLLKKRLKREEKKILMLFPDNYNLEIPSEEYDYLIPGPTAKAMMKKAASAERNTPEGKARMKRVRLNAMADPSAVRMHKLATKAAWQNPEIKASRVAAFNTEEGKKNRSEGAAIGWIKRKEHLKDPEFAAKDQERIRKSTESLRKTYSSPEMREQCSRIATESWKVPGRVEKVSESLEEFYSEPENRKRHSETMKKHPPFSKNPKKK